MSVFVGIEWVKILKTYRWPLVSCHVVSNATCYYSRPRGSIAEQLEVQFYYEFAGSHAAWCLWCITNAEGNCFDEVHKLCYNARRKAQAHREHNRYCADLFAE